MLREHLDEVVNKTWDFAGRIETHKDGVMNAILGLAGEAGEVADRAKKAYFHQEKDLNWTLEQFRYELGDVMYYWLKVVDLLGMTPEEVLKANREKLESRHPELGKVTERFSAEAIR
jgi:NTP pyrophosphatase (non-canonical NTP hydrolase)